MNDPSHVPAYRAPALDEPADIPPRRAGSAPLRWLACGALVGLRGVALPVDAQVTPERADRIVGAVERLDPALDALVPADAVIEVLARGHSWTEGPVWVPELGGLLYSDIPASAIYIYRAGTGSRPWIEPTGDHPGGSGASNGLILDDEGRLLLAQHGPRRIARLESGWRDPSPVFRTLAAEFEGRRFNSPNDLVLRDDGSLYFTDPPYGLAGGDEDPAKELEVNGVYRLAPDGSVELLVDDLMRPNGVALSPDQDVLYVADSDPDQGVIMAYDLQPGGGVGEGRVFFESWGDGMAVDGAGNLYVAGPGNGVLVLSPDGVHLGSLRTGERTSNVAFGDDGSTLYITAETYLMGIQLAPGPVAAQQNSGPELVGERFRLTLQGSLAPVEGTLTALTSDSLVVNGADGTESRVGRDRLLRVERYAGGAGGGALKGLAWGGGVGLLAGGLVGALVGAAASRGGWQTVQLAEGEWSGTLAVGPGREGSLFVGVRLLH